MGSARPALTPHAVSSSDTSAVLDVINADQVPGQPTCTAEMLAEAVAGRSTVDAGWWAELDRVAVDVLRDEAGLIHGVVSYAHRARDDAGLILWLHGQEQPAVIDALLDHALNQLAGAVSVEAYEFATALGVGLEGLPVRHRPVTRQALLAHGFVEADLWRYMRRTLPATDLPLAEGADIAPDSARPGWVVTLPGADGAKCGESEVSIAAPGLGVLWWISVEADHRGQGLGQSLLGSALDVLHREDVREVILFVDDDAPPDDPERGRGAANALYDRAGFIEVDRLCSYRRQ